MTAPQIYNPPEPEYQEPAEVIRMAGRIEEAALLGSILRRPQLFEELCETVKPDSFGWQAYGQAWAAMLAVQNDGLSIDALTVGDELERRGNLSDFVAFDSGFGYSGRAALSWIRDQGQPQNARSYAEIVQDYAAKRRIGEIMSLGATWSANGRKAADILTDLEKKLGAVQVGAGKAAKHGGMMKEAVAKAFDRTDKASRGLITFIPSGFRALDDKITGFSAPDLTIIGARPGMGKTALMAAFADHAARNGKRVGFFTLEMGMEQIAMRFISMRTGITFKQQQTGNMSDEQWPQYCQAVEELGSGEMGIYLNDLPGISPNTMRRELRRNGPFDLVIFDYLQLASPDDKYNARHLEVAAIARAMKNACKEFEVPILAGAQLNRAGEARAKTDKRPILSDLGESDEIAKAADNVIFIHAEEKESTSREIIVEKQRNGPTGICTLDYIGFKTLFQNQKGITA